MNLKRIAVAGGVALAIAVPAGIAVAATGSPSPSPSPSPSTSTSRPSTGPGSGYGYGRMMGGMGDPEDCPFYDSSDPAAAQLWREHRAQRQQMMQQAHRGWSATPTPSAS